jgi:hypothetical protein
MKILPFFYDLNKRPLSGLNYYFELINGEKNEK